MTTICHPLPLTVTQDGRTFDYRDDRAPRLLWTSAEPRVATVGCDDWSFTLLLDSVARGLDSEWVCPFGGASYRPWSQGPHRWLFIDIHADGWDGTTVTVWAERVSGFLGEVLEHCARGDRPSSLCERDHEPWPRRRLFDGGA